LPATLRSVPAKQRVILLVLAAVAIVVAIIVIPSLSDDKKSDTTKTTGGATTATPGQPQPPKRKPAAPVIVVRNGKPVGGVTRLEFNKGDTVKFTVKSDVADEIHVHGYDIKKDVPAGGQVTMSFKADADGIYEAELEKLGQQIIELRINP
jgi:heme/copper-type cytochrome/quinol oxidase subunit 2